jgi:hypothetical protein
MAEASENRHHQTNMTQDRGKKGCPTRRWGERALACVEVNAEHWQQCGHNDEAWRYAQRE